MTFSIVIPSLNEAVSLQKTLEQPELAKMSEVQVVDGGSDDETLAILKKYEVKILCEREGRGWQLHRGAECTSGEVIIFLHADTLLPPNAVHIIKMVLQDKEVVGGHFKLSYSEDHWQCHCVEFVCAVLSLIGICYGDSVFFVRREAYIKSGGFRDYPIFEDLDFVSRIRKYGRFQKLPFRVVSSPRRFLGKSFYKVLALWVLMQILYWCCISPVILGKC
ncbi:MAG: TIGR04283 family arsenosugar biosynthesis glycosyltransferase, partial [Verrucomicrobiota bacterium]